MSFLHQNYTLDWLLTRHEQSDRPKYLFFWSHQPRRDGRISESCLSQWWIAPFEIDGLRYRTAEHYMMAEKARLFSDKKVLNKILDSTSPAEAKKLGRTVQNFNTELWDSRCFDIVVTGNYHKFSQNPDLHNFLRTTSNRILVEASPVDSIWGIGLDKDNVDIERPAKWPGKNLLGFALMEVRDQLQ